MIKNPLKLQTYNDGLVEIYEAVAPFTIAATPKNKLCYEDRTVGVTRHYAALHENEKIAHLLRCPRIKTVTTEDVAVLEGEQFNIKFIQYPQEVTPPSMDLTLETARAEYSTE